MPAVVIRRCDEVVFLRESRGDQLLLRMVDQFSVGVHQVEIAAVGQRHMVEQLREAVVLEVYQQHTAHGALSARDFHGGGKRNHADVAMLRVDEQVLNFRRCKVQVLRSVERLLKPLRLPDIHAGLTERGRRGGEQIPVQIVQSDVFHIARIGSVEQLQFGVDRVAVDINVFNDVVVDGVREPEHVAKVRVDRLVDLFDEHFVLTLDRLLQLT
ncbi:hypothetical protein SDC9_154879 [bioreactor metagenome]|uniref:Uncharacterized protein n=1 Tax=bioreactor metagenome TaxID=1076179 RepID=A0A645EZY1_9ZZZZ